MGGRNTPNAPTRPTMPETTPMLSEYSSEMYLNTEALPTDHVTPITNISVVNAQTLSPICMVKSPLAVLITKSACGYDRKNRHPQEISITHQVTGCAPYLSEIQPPTARRTPPGSEKH